MSHDATDCEYCPHYQDPSAKKSYGWRWRSWLPLTVDLASSTWTITPSGPTLSGSTNDTDDTSVYVANIAAGVKYYLSNHIVTDAVTAEEDTRSHVIIGRKL